MKALVVGASAGVGRALTEALARCGYDLLLVASDTRDLNAQAAHLHLVYGVRVETIAADAAQIDDCLSAIRSVARSFGTLDSLFFPIGVSHSDDRGALSFKESQRLLNANLLVVIGIVGDILPALLESGRGNIVGFGSVAAVRGRRANIVYAAAKRGLESYFESLRHLTAKTAVRVQFYRLGYVETQQTFGRVLLFPTVTPKSVADTVIRNLYRDKGRTSLPRYWGIISFILSLLPWPIFKLLDF